MKEKGLKAFADATRHRFTADEYLIVIFVSCEIKPCSGWYHSLVTLEPQHYTGLNRHSRNIRKIKPETHVDDNLLTEELFINMDAKVISSSRIG